MLRGRGGGAVVVSCRGGKRGVVHTGDLCGSVMAKEVIYQTEILEGYRLDSATSERAGQAAKRSRRGHPWGGGRSNLSAGDCRQQCPLVAPFHPAGCRSHTLLQQQLLLLLSAPAR